MQLRDRCTITGKGADPKPRRCIYYTGEANEVNPEPGRTSILMEARVIVDPDPVILAWTGYGGITVTHHGRDYTVTGKADRFDPTGRLLHHTLQLTQYYG